MDNTIAWLGLGRMGSRMGCRLIEQGHHLTVWNRTPQRADALAKAGAQVAQSPAAAAADADLVITMLSDVDALHGVLFGDNGVLAGMRPGALLVQMATIGPQAVREIAGRLPAGIEMVDAPVIGSTPAAAAGSLTVLVGGSAAALNRVEPVLSALGTIRRCGELGSASSMKLVVNTAMVDGVAAVADALALADAVGVPREAALAALREGPMEGVVKRVTSPAEFSIALGAKDLRLAMAAAGVPLPVTEGASSRLDDAVVVGLADKDIAAIV